MPVIPGENTVLGSKENNSNNDAKTTVIEEPKQEPSIFQTKSGSAISQDIGEPASREELMKRDAELNKK